ncbi:MAG TPA: TPM domain-containing protein, partial [Arthrobacter sp.]|nr:TPM domain-containing protein [Arthrobacter sp.]
MRSTYKRLLAVLGVVGLLALPAAPALAEDPVTLDPVTKVVDSAQVLGDRRGEVEQAIKQLGADHAMTYHVVYVDRFENPTDRYEWAKEVADTASLGANAMLLTVATDTRQYLLSKPSNSKITDAQRDTIVTSAVDPNLRNGDYAQAAIDSAAAIGDAAGGGKGTVPSEGGGAGSAVLVGVGVVAAGGAGAYLYLRNRRKKA